MDTRPASALKMPSGLTWKKSRIPSKWRCRNWSPRLTVRANRATYPRRSGCLFFTTSVKTSERRYRRRIFPRLLLKEHQQA